MRIDFAWFLSIWILNCHRPEREFWKSMNPARIVYLFQAQERPKKEQEKNKKINSLSAFLMGGE